MEELCPFPLEALQQQLKKYPNAKGAITTTPTYLTLRTAGLLNNIHSTPMFICLVLVTGSEQIRELKKK